MEVMKKFYGAVCVVFITIAVVLLLTNNVCASQTSSVINSTIKNKKFELPSKIHKDGEGFYEVGRMLTPRYRHSSVLLQDGRVFIVGGSDGNDILNTTEIFDPKTGKSTKGPDMPYPGFECTLKLLSNGNILIVGGKYSNQNRVSVYYPKENKIIEARGRLTCKTKSAVIEEIYDDIVFIKDRSLFTSKTGINIYNKKTNRLSIGYFDASFLDYFDYYIGNIKDELYFISYSRDLLLYILAIEPNKDFSKMILKSTQYNIDLKNINGIDTSHGILLNDKKTLFIHSDYNTEYVLFDTCTKTFKKINPNIKLGGIRDLSLLENGNIIFANLFRTSMNIVELNPFTGSGVIKPYTAPHLAEFSVVNLDGKNLLYTGGAKHHSGGYITFGYYYGVSDKIYLWKTKKENN